MALFVDEKECSDDGTNYGTITLLLTNLKEHKVSLYETFDAFLKIFHSFFKECNSVAVTIS